ncbi:hypothetical protein P7K49_004432 [Saguinus oedipus]|uniref:Chromo domain-containing protein n=1 Tax=Saguinus oedipus TaxID=9490 RepID=A0ABQ9W839_SAGOE|nr:hypothetical protein P7K49_004432 [Saguinus oedipus]
MAEFLHGIDPLRQLKAFQSPSSVTHHIPTIWKKNPDYLTARCYGLAESTGLHPRLLIKHQQKINPHSKTLKLAEPCFAEEIVETFHNDGHFCSSDSDSGNLVILLRKFYQLPHKHTLKQEDSKLWRLLWVSTDVSNTANARCGSSSWVTLEQCRPKLHLVTKSGVTDQRSHELGHSPALRILHKELPNEPRQEKAGKVGKLEIMEYWKRRELHGDRWLSASEVQDMLEELEDGSQDAWEQWAVTSPTPTTADAPSGFSI